MGSLSVQDSSGHVEIKWDENSIDIDLAPSEVGVNKANEKERARVHRIVKGAIEKGFFGRFFTRQRDKGEAIDINKLHPSLPDIIRIKLTKDAFSVKEIIEKVVQTDIVSPLCLFQISPDGQGTVIQKNTFVADDRDYISVAPQAGG